MWKRKKSIEIIEIIGIQISHVYTHTYILILSFDLKQSHTQTYIHIWTFTQSLTAVTKSIFMHISKHLLYEFLGFVYNNNTGFSIRERESE